MSESLLWLFIGAVAMWCYNKMIEDMKREQKEKR